MEKGGRNRQTDRDTNRQGDTDTETPNSAREKSGNEWGGETKRDVDSACGVQVNTHAADNRRQLVQRIVFRPARVVSLGRHFPLFPHTHERTLLQFG